jgi:hypothetical protein
MTAGKSGAHWGFKTQNKDASLAAREPFAALAAGVLVQASKEAMEGDLGAARWLAGDFAGMFCEVVGVDHAAIQRKATTWMEAPAGRLIVRLSV